MSISQTPPPPLLQATAVTPPRAQANFPHPLTLHIWCIFCTHECGNRCKFLFTTFHECATLDKSQLGRDQFGLRIFMTRHCGLRALLRCWVWVAAKATNALPCAGAGVYSGVTSWQDNFAPTCLRCCPNVATMVVALSGPLAYM